MSRIDAIVFIGSIVFFLSVFRQDDCYSDECPRAVKPWLLVTFFAFYTFQLVTFSLFKIKSRKHALVVFALDSLVMMPGMLALNIWGNMLIEQMDKTPDCNYNGWAQSFQMLFLISNYCIIFIYIIFLLTIKETLKRFYAYIDRPAN